MSAPEHYETVAASQTAQVLGGDGAVGDYIDRLIIVVATAATGTVALLDLTTSISIMPASPGGGIGVYTVELKMTSKKGAWSITTGAGASVIAVGRFT